MKFTPEQTSVVGETLNIQWKAEADFLAKPYKGSDAYETHDGLMVALQSFCLPWRSVSGVTENDAKHHSVPPADADQFALARPLGGCARRANNLKRQARRATFWPLRKYFAVPAPLGPVIAASEGCKHTPLNGIASKHAQDDPFDVPEIGH
jgi:hypothetical protein